MPLAEKRAATIDCDAPNPPTMISPAAFVVMAVAPLFNSFHEAWRLVALLQEVAR